MNCDKLKPGLRVQFRLGDVYLPDIAEVLNRMTEDTELQGSVTLLSDAGEERAAFAVVEVKGVLMPIIVPAAAIRAVSGCDDGIGRAEAGLPETARSTVPAGSQD